MIMDFAKSKKLYFIIYGIFIAIAVKLFVPFQIGGFNIADIPPFFMVENRFLRLVCIFVVAFIGQMLGSMLATRISNSEFDRMLTILHLDCESKPFIEEFAPIAASIPSNLSIGLGKALLYMQGLFAAGKYDEVIKEGEKALEYNMGKGRVHEYLTRTSVCQYLIMALCESGNTARATALFKELEETAGHTHSDGVKNGKARSIVDYTRDYIKYTVNPAFCDTAITAEEYSMCDNNYEKVMIRYQLGRLYMRAGNKEKAHDCFNYVANHRGDFVCREDSRIQLEKVAAMPDLPVEAEAEHPAVEE
ncbi:MAG: hypothetical protein IKU72_02405 [Oscillospiraceae bacterium]|nr:hypothetical protein [Oscillospiraceae bacterium]